MWWCVGAVVWWWWWWCVVVVWVYGIIMLVVVVVVVAVVAVAPYPSVVHGHTHEGLGPGVVQQHTVLGKHTAVQGRLLLVSVCVW
jgi:hypothetical protein